jgi:hypothetical protein
MRHAPLLGLLLLAGCPQARSVAVTFGDTSEGLDGFMCKDTDGVQLLDKVGDAGTGASTFKANLVADFVDLEGVPGCRASQLIKWCATHKCHPLEGTRSCVPVELPTGVGAMKREDLRVAVANALTQARGGEISRDAPDKFVMLRMVATTQPCDALLSGAEFDKSKLVGCAYSCPVLFDKIEQEVYLGFDTLTATCAQGVRTCSEPTLTWQP